MTERSESGRTKTSWLSGTWRRSLHWRGKKQPRVPNGIQFQPWGPQSVFKHLSGPDLTSIAFSGRLTVMAPPKRARCE
jgi:hypothetical protein